MTYQPGQTFSAEADGLVTYEVLYRANLLRWTRKSGYSHKRCTEGQVAMIRRIEYDPCAVFDKLAGMKIGMHGAALFIGA